MDEKTFLELHVMPFLKKVISLSSMGATQEQRNYRSTLVEVEAMKNIRQLYTSLEEHSTSRDVPEILKSSMQNIYKLYVSMCERAIHSTEYAQERTAVFEDIKQLIVGPEQPNYIENVLLPFIEEVYSHDNITYVCWYKRNLDTLVQALLPPDLLFYVVQQTPGVNGDIPREWHLLKRVYNAMVNTPDFVSKHVKKDTPYDFKQKKLNASVYLLAPVLLLCYANRVQSNLLDEVFTTLGKNYYLNKNKAQIQASDAWCAGNLKEEILDKGFLIDMLDMRTWISSIGSFLGLPRTVHLLLDTCLLKKDELGNPYYSMDYLKKCFSRDAKLRVLVSLIRYRFIGNDSHVSPETTHVYIQILKTFIYFSENSSEPGKQNKNMYVPAMYILQDVGLALSVLNTYIWKKNESIHDKNVLRKELIQVTHCIGAVQNVWQDFIKRNKSLIPSMLSVTEPDMIREIMRAMDNDTAWPSYAVPMTDFQNRAFFAIVSWVIQKGGLTPEEEEILRKDVWLSWESMTWQQGIDSPQKYGGKASLFLALLTLIERGYLQDKKNGAPFTLQDPGLMALSLYGLIGLSSSYPLKADREAYRKNMLSMIEMAVTNIGNTTGDWVSTLCSVQFAIQETRNLIKVYKKELSSKTVGEDATYQHATYCVEETEKLLERFLNDPHVTSCLQKQVQGFVAQCASNAVSIKKFGDFMENLAVLSVPLFKQCMSALPKKYRNVRFLFGDPEEQFKDNLTEDTPPVDLPPGIRILCANPDIQFRGAENHPSYYMVRVLLGRSTTKASPEVMSYVVPKLVITTIRQYLRLIRKDNDMVSISRPQVKCDWIVSNYATLGDWIVSNTSWSNVKKLIARTELWKESVVKTVSGHPIHHNVPIHQECLGARYNKWRSRNRKAEGGMLSIPPGSSLDISEWNTIACSLLTHNDIENIFNTSSVPEAHSSAIYPGTSIFLRNFILDAGYIPKSPYVWIPHFDTFSCALPKDICPQKKEFLYNAVSRFMSTLEYYKNKKSSLGSLDINKATSTYPPVLQIMEANGVWDVLEDWEERAGQDIVHDVILALVYGMSGRLSYEAGCLQYKSLNKSLQDRMSCLYQQGGIPSHILNKTLMCTQTPRAINKNGEPYTLPDSGPSESILEQGKKMYEIMWHEKLIFNSPETFLTRVDTGEYFLSGFLNDEATWGGVSLDEAVLNAKNKKLPHFFLSIVSSPVYWYEKARYPQDPTLVKLQEKVLYWMETLQHDKESEIGKYFDEEAEYSSIFSIYFFSDFLHGINDAIKLAPEDIQYTVMHDIFSFANAIPFRDLLYPGNTLENKIKGKISDAPLPDFIHTYCDEIQQFSEYANTFMLQKQDMKSTDIDFGDIM